MLELFYPLWNLDYESPAGIFECWQFRFISKEVHSSVRVCVLMHACLFFLSNIYQAAIVIVNSF